MDQIFRRRPFKIRNADEYGLEGVLNLFVSPVDGLASPFDYENSIIKGRMGSGKTMYLRANHAYYLYGMVPGLMDGGEIILPILIRLSDFQHIRDPVVIYKEIIVKIVEEMTSIYLRLQDARQLAELHSGIRVLTDDMLAAHQFVKNMRSLARLGSEEYIERVTLGLGLRGGVKNRFFQASAEWSHANLVEFKRKPNPGIKDIEECYRTLLENQEGRILLLIDEAGALDRSFFTNEFSGSSLFETLMNQFRTSAFIRTKIAIYPNSYSDILTETRYGDSVLLEEFVRDEGGYRRYYERTLSLIANYLNPDPDAEGQCEVADVFEIPNGIYGGCLEQILYASNGNMRRLIQMLDMAMNQAYVLAGQKPVVVTKYAATEALKLLASRAETLFTEQERGFLGDLVAACRARGGFKFTFPNMSPVLYKYTNRSQEYNIINVDSLGAGRRGTVYDFDYAYAVLKDIPTHYQIDSEKINRERSLDGGAWIGRTVQINEEVMSQASLPGKVDGKVGYFLREKEHGFIESDAGEEFFFRLSDLIDTDQGRPLMTGRRVRFYPYKVGDVSVAAHVELL